MSDEVPAAPASLRAQIVVYENPPAQIRRLVSGLGATLAHARAAGLLGHAELRVGDSSEVATLAATELLAWCEQAGIGDAEYETFGANLGSARGNNRLASGAATDYLLLVNPDTYPAPTMVHRQMRAFEPSVAAVEARQTPVEHPKSYDPATWRAGWLSCAGLMVRRAAFEEVGGFDAEHFFLHGDDVDLSWRLRLAGYELVTAPDAIVFHDKRIGPEGRVVAPRAERYHHVLGKLMLSERYGLDDVARSVRGWVDAEGGATEREAVAEFDERQRAGRVPTRLAGAERLRSVRDRHLAPLRF